MSENRRIHLRVSTAAEWVTNNPVLGLGEPGFESDTRVLRIGDGITAFVSLAGFSIAGDALINAIAALTTANNQMLYFTGVDTVGITALTAAGRAILDDANAPAQRTTLGLAIGTDVQAYDAALASLAGLTLVAGDILYATGADTFVRLAKGTAGQMLQINAGATAPEWVTPGAVLLGTIATTSGTSQSLASLVLTPYKFLRFVFNAVSGTADITCTLGGIRCSEGSTGAGGTLYGLFDLDLATGIFNAPVGPQASNIQSWGGKTTYSTATNSITVAAVGGSFDAGSILVYGIK